MVDGADISPSHGAQYFSRAGKDRAQFLAPELQNKERYSRSEVLTAFGNGYKRFEVSAKRLLTANDLDENIVSKWQKGEELTQAEKNKLSHLDAKTKKILGDFEVLTNGRSLTLDKGQDNFPHSFGDYAAKEGVPVEGLLNFLHSEIQEIRAKASRGEIDPNTAKQQISELFSEGRVIYKSSRLADRNLRVKRGADAVEGTMAHARAQAEAKYIAGDPLRQSGSDKDNFIRGIEVMQSRRELKIPKSNINEKGEIIRDEAEQQAEDKGAETKKGGKEDRPLTLEEAAGLGDAGSKLIDELHHDASSDTDSGSDAPPLEGGDKGPSTVESPAATGESDKPGQADLGDIRRELYIVNRSVDVRHKAAEIAEAQLREEMRRGKWWNPKDFFRRVKLRLAEEFYRQKYKERALKAMLENNNSYMDFDCVKDAVRDANHNREGQKKSGESVISQMKTGELIAGQKVTEAKGELKKAILNDILQPIIDGRISNEGDIRKALQAFVEAHHDDPDVQAVFGRDTSKYNVLADFFATDLMEMGTQVKDDIVNHRYALDQIDQHVKISLANTSWGAQTEANFNFVDKAVAWAQDKPWKGAILNPASIGAITSLAYSGIMVIGRSKASRSLNLVAPGLGSLLGGGFAAARRWHDLNVDIASHRAEMAYGFEAPKGAKRREAIEKLNYNTASFNDLINGGGKELSTGVDREGIDQLLQADLTVEANQQKIMQRIAEISQRLDLSVSQHIDLITAQGSRDALRQVGGLSEQESLDVGRMELVKQIARMKVALRRAGISEGDLTTKLDQAKSNWEKLLLQNKEQQDKATRNYKLKQAAAAGVFGGAMGMASYFGTQELFALGERALGMNVGETSLEHIIGKLGDLAAGRPHIEAPTAGLMSDFYDHGGQYTLNNHLQMQVDPATHQVSFTDNMGHIRTDIPPMTLDANGHMGIAGQLPPDVQSAFNQLHFNVDANGGPDILNSGAASHVDLATGHQTVIPNGTEWVNDHGKWDLVLSADHSKTLINDAVFNPNGTISQYDLAHSLINDPAKVDFGQVAHSSLEKVIGGATQHESMTTGFKTVIPDGTHWAHDSADPTKWDLVSDSDPSKIMVNDVTFDSHGVISSYDAANSLIKDPGLVNLGKYEANGSGAGLLDKLAHYRVVHAKNEVAIPMKNYVESTGDEAHPWKVLFRFPEGTVHNPNTGLTESLHDAATNNRLGLLLQMPTTGNEGVSFFVPAHWDAVTHTYVVAFDPTDHATMINMPDGTQMSMADIATKFLNENELKTYLTQQGVKSQAELASETWFEGRRFFNMANPDGLIEHQGRILGGYWDPNSDATKFGFTPGPGMTEKGAFIVAAHAVHGSSPLSAGGPTSEPPIIDGKLITDIADKLKPPTILPIDIKGPELIPPVGAPPGIPLPWAPRLPLEPVQGFKSEPPEAPPIVPPVKKEGEQEKSVTPEAAADLTQSGQNLAENLTGPGSVTSAESTLPTGEGAAEVAKTGGFASYGSSHRGGRSDKPDEDAILSLNRLHLGEMGASEDPSSLLEESKVKELAATLGVSEAEISVTLNSLNELISSGDIKSLDIVCDGMGGHGSGEYASSVAVYTIMKSLVARVKAGDIGEAAIKQAIIDADQEIKRVKPGAGAAISLAITGKNGETFIGSVGDTRAYKRDKDGRVDLLTNDDNLALSQLIAGSFDKPSEFFNHPQKNVISNALGDLKSDMVHTAHLKLEPGEKLILACDGVWEGLPKDAATQALLNSVDEQFAIDCKTMSRALAVKKAFANMFGAINLGGLPKDATPEQIVDKLVNASVGENSHDNVSAVVIENKGEKTVKPAESTPSDKTEAAAGKTIKYIDSVAKRLSSDPTEQKNIRDGLWGQMAQETIDLIGKDVINEADFIETVAKIYQVEQDKKIEINTKIGTFDRAASGELVNIVEPHLRAIIKNIGLPQEVADSNLSAITTIIEMNPEISDKLLHSDEVHQRALILLVVEADSLYLKIKK